MEAFTMDNAYRMFLLAVKHMNFTKAADEIFVTQQCLSNHIKRLERELETDFFTFARARVRIPV